MDSNIYLKISEKLSELFPNKVRELPLDMIASDFNSSVKYLEAIKLFIEDAKVFLNFKKTYFDPILFKLILLNHSTLFKKEIDDSNKANSIGLVNLIARHFLNRSGKEDSIINPWILSLFCFILESSLHYGFCENRSEQYIKRASHIAASEIIDQLYCVQEKDAIFIIGYLISSWYFAQKTEGIIDSSDQIFINIKNPIFLLDGKEYKINIEEIKFNLPD